MSEWRLGIAESPPTILPDSPFGNRHLERALGLAGKPRCMDQRLTRLCGGFRLRFGRPLSIALIAALLVAMSYWGKVGEATPKSFERVPEWLWPELTGVHGRS